MQFQNLIKKIFASLWSRGSETTTPKYFYYRNELDYFKIERAGNLHRLGW